MQVKFTYEGNLYTLECPATTPEELKEHLKTFVKAANDFELEVGGEILESRHLRTNNLDIYAVKPKILQHLNESHNQLSEIVYNWWIKAMPGAYFRDLDDATRMSHLRALIALRMAGQKQEMTLYSTDETRCTFIKPVNYVGLLHDVMKTLPKHKRIKEANIYTAVDEDLVIDVFEFERGKEKVSVNVRDKFKDVREDKEELIRFIESADGHYGVNTDVKKIQKHFELVSKARATECVVVDGSDSQLLLVLQSDDDAWTNECILRIVKYLSSRMIDIKKAQIIRFDGYRDRNYLVMTFVVSAENHDYLDEVVRVPYLDDAVIVYWDANPHLSVNDAELVIGVSKFIQSVLLKTKPLIYTTSHILSFLANNQGIVDQLVTMFNIKFADKNKSSVSSRFPVIEQLYHRLKVDIERQTETEEVRTFFRMFLSIIENTIKTNISLSSRCGLVLKLNADFVKHIASIHAHSLIYFIGRGYIGFHLKLRDIARGGMRVSVPVDQEEYANRLKTLIFDTIEQAQLHQLKNKDIPEGGAHMHMQQLACQANQPSFQGKIIHAPEYVKRFINRLPSKIVLLSKNFR